MSSFCASSSVPASGTNRPIFLHIIRKKRHHDENGLNDLSDCGDPSSSISPSSQPTSLLPSVQDTFERCYQRLYMSLIRKVGTRERLRSSIQTVLDTKFATLPTTTTTTTVGAVDDSDSSDQTQSSTSAPNVDDNGLYSCVSHVILNNTHGIRPSKDCGGDGTVTESSLLTPLCCSIKTTTTTRGHPSAITIHRPNDDCVSIEWSQIAFLQSLVVTHHSHEDSGDVIIPKDRSNRIVSFRVHTPAIATDNECDVRPSGRDGHESVSTMMKTPHQHLDDNSVSGEEWRDRPLWAWTEHERTLAYGATAALDFADLWCRTVDKGASDGMDATTIQWAVSDSNECPPVNHTVAGSKRYDYDNGHMIQVMLVIHDDPLSSTIPNPTKDLANDVDSCHQVTYQHTVSSTTTGDPLLFVSQEEDADTATSSLDYTTFDHVEEEDQWKGITESPTLEEAQQPAKDSYFGGHDVEEDVVMRTSDDQDGAMTSSTTACTTSIDMTEGANTLADDTTPRTAEGSDIVPSEGDTDQRSYDNHVGSITYQQVTPPHLPIPYTHEAVQASIKVPQIDSAGMDLTLLSQLPPQIRSEARLVMAIAQQRQQRRKRQIWKTKKSAIGRWLTSNAKTTFKTDDTVTSDQWSSSSSQNRRSSPTSPGSTKKKKKTTKVMEDFFRKQTIS